MWVKIQMWYWNMTLDWLHFDVAHGYVDQFQYYEKSSRIQQKLSDLGKQLNN